MPFQSKGRRPASRVELHHESIESKRMRMQDTYSYLVDALRAMPIVFQALLQGCTQEQAQARRGGDDGWSVLEVLSPA